MAVEIPLRGVMGSTSSIQSPSRGYIRTATRTQNQGIRILPPGQRTDMRRIVYHRLHRSALGRCTFYPNSVKRCDSFPAHLDDIAVNPEGLHLIILFQLHQLPTHPLNTHTTQSDNTTTFLFAVMASSDARHVAILLVRPRLVGTRRAPCFGKKARPRPSSPPSII